MDPVRTTEMLDLVREDHELLAEHMRMLGELERADNLGDEQHLDRSLTLLREVARYIRMDLLPHLESEEVGFFMVLREYLPQGSTLLYELESEHEQMRQMCGRLCGEIDLLRHKKHHRPAIFAELRSMCGRVGDLLRQHAEREDTLVQNYIKSIEQSGSVHAICNSLAE